MHISAKGINIIGDIHGDFEDLMSLVRIMPSAPFLSVGDMIDRGPKSLEVLRFFMEPGNRAVLGNHEHMMLDTYFGRGRYGKGIWLDYRNGGYQTLKSFAPDALIAWEYLQAEKGKSVTVEELLKFLRKNKYDLFPADVIAWVDQLPLYCREKGLLVTHAPRSPEVAWRTLLKSKEAPLMRTTWSGPLFSLLWHIGEPKPIKGILQVNGHIITPEVVVLKESDGKPYSISIDTCRGYSTKLTGLHWPSLEIFQVTSGETLTTQNLLTMADQD